MIKSNKQKRKSDVSEETPKKKVKFNETTEKNIEKPTKIKKNIEKEGGKKFVKSKGGKFKSFSKDGKKLEKPADWNEFKKKKKEVQIKRKQSRNFFDVIVQAKKIGEELRKKTLKTEPERRKKLTEELHSLLGGQKNYAKFVLTHDMARIVQYMLKFGAEKIRKEIAEVRFRSFKKNPR